METHQLNKTSLNYPYELPELNYSYDSLEPYIDTMTMEIHHSRHHKAYIDNLNKAISGSDFEKTELTELFKNISKLPVAIRNNGGGHFNHSFFWNNLGKSDLIAPGGKLASAIEKKFGSIDNFKTQFSDAAKTRFGSGWAWLSVDADLELFVSSTPNQDNPFMDVAEQKGTPILGLDVWEHAYYLKYQNKRPDYIEAFWNVVNWKEVERRFEKLIS
jgi:superoxide dismutase, Fe-Mn family